MNKSTKYQIIAYPLDSVVSTPKLFYDVNQIETYSICWTFEPTKAMLFDSFEVCQKNAEQLRTVCPEYLILVETICPTSIIESAEQLLITIKNHLKN